MTNATQTLEDGKNFTSLKAETREEKIKMVNILLVPDYSLKDFINREITMKDLYIEMTEVFDKVTGVAETRARTVIIDENGKSYLTISNGVYNSIKKIVSIFGLPTWNDGITVRVKELHKGSFSILTLEVVG